MRAPILVTALAALALAGILLTGPARPAHGEDADLQAKLRAMEKRQDVLELQVAYLLEREEDLTKYVTANLARGKALAENLRRARAEGFTQAAISSTSREILLGSLEAAARAMQEEVPVLTEEQERLLKEIDQRKRRP